MFASNTKSLEKDQPGVGFSSVVKASEHDPSPYPGAGPWNKYVSESMKNRVSGLECPGDLTWPLSPRTVS